MPANIPPLRRRVPMPKLPKHDTDGLEQYYDYDVRDDSEIEKELKHKRNDRISTVAAYISLTSLASGVITGILAECLNSDSFAIITLVLFVIMVVSVFIGICFDDDHYII